MPAAPLHPDEAHRMAAVRKLRLLGTPAEERFDKITRLARRMFGVPVCVIDILGDKLVWVKSVQGLDVTEAPRATSYCAYAVLEPEVCLVHDARVDPRLFDNPNAEEHVFYAGVPLEYQGQRVGVLCITDSKPRTLTDEELSALYDLAALAEHELQVAGLSESQLRLSEENEQLVHLTLLLRGATDGMKEALYVFEAVRENGVIVDFRIVETNEVGCYRLGRSSKEIVGALYTKMFPTAQISGLVTLLAEVVETGNLFDEEVEIQDTSINAHWVHVHATKFGDGVSITSADITTSKIREKVLEERALIDALTRIWNRGAILDIVLSELDSARLHQKSLAVGLLDIDFFKNVNDTYGHAAGDEVLRKVSERLRQAIRPTDAVGRYGGEEFLIVFPDCGAGVVAAADRIRREVCADPIMFGEIPISITVSVGTAVAPKGVALLETLILVADNALYRAKNEGRNRVCLGIFP